MRAAQAWEIARRRLASELARDFPATVVFVADEDVIYRQGREIVVARPALFDLDSERWEPLLEPRPTWIHFNLLTAGADPVIVAVRRSQASMSPDDPQATAVNVSAESGYLLSLGS